MDGMQIDIIAGQTACASAIGLHWIYISIV